MYDATKGFHMTPTGIDRAIAITGSGTQLASKLGVSHQVVYRWHAKGFVPRDRAQQISELTGVPVRDLLDPKLVSLLEMVR